ncbi:MAG TPA: lytic transglycosylase domain-containing protein, partial [Roseiarcus sp.]|nr:lytic transglycosylase domain-containing protein [Roseiarcus sp.]
GEKVAAAASASARPALAVDPTPTGGIGPQALPPAKAASPPLAAEPVSRVDASRIGAAAAFYRKGDEAEGDALARQAADPLQRAALEWVALRLAAQPDDRRLAAFAAAHPQWPGGDWIRAEQEAHLYTERPAPPIIAALFAADPPRTPAGKLAAARAALDAGRRDEATGIVRALWREGDFDAWTEGAVLKDFASALTRADHKYRADRLLYAERTAPALRAAALAGADEVALAQARVAAMAGPLTPRAIGAVPAALQGDPGLLFARVQDARRANRALEAAAWLARAPSDEAALIDPDKWWSERRMVARELLDLGEFEKAYEICAAARPASVPARIDAAFHAGWIALRFANDAPEAARRFAAASQIAQTPLSIARAAYWQGRAAEAMGQGEEARRFFERAAQLPIAYYGQVAAKRLGRGDFALRTPAAVAAGDKREEATRVVELLYAAGLDDLATPLAEAGAERWRDEAQIAALAQVVAAHGDATASVEFGKIATERGFALDETAFPIYGVPRFAPLPHSADLPSVYAVARQESEFAWRAVSGAGAKGLMQILPATAQSTARRAGVAFDPSRLSADPAFNTQLGAAFLGQLIEDEGGSLELALAAYNAGGGRVAQWLAAYGDPRTGKIDPVDWVERIPFDETRDYVQRVIENLGVYRARLGAWEGAPAHPPRMARE